MMTTFDQNHRKHEMDVRSRLCVSLAIVPLLSWILCFGGLLPIVSSWSHGLQPYLALKPLISKNNGKSTPVLSNHLKSSYKSSPSKLFQMNQNDDMDENVNDDDIWDNRNKIFNDFEGFSIGEGATEYSSSFSSTPQSEVLSNLVENIREKEVEQSQKRIRNWNRGNWEVRGFSLDPYQAPGVDNTMGGNISNKENDNENSNFVFSDQETNDEYKNDPTNPKIFTKKNRRVESIADVDETPIHVCKIVVEETEDSEIDDQLVAVGRSDGSVFIMRLGSEYVTSFQAVPKISFEPTDDVNPLSDEDEKMSVMKIKSNMVRSDSINQNKGTDNNNDKRSNSADQFEIVGQFHHNDGSSSSYAAPISAMFYTNNHIYTAMQGSGEVKQWSLDDGNDGVSISSRVLGGGSNHANAITTLKGFNDDSNNARYLLSTSLDGSFIIYNRNTGVMLQKVFILTHDNIANEPPAPILCADVEYVDDTIILYFGLSTGQIVAYELNEVLSTNIDQSFPSESCRFFVDPDSKSGSVTSIKCAGFGTETLSSKSTILITGGENGVIKQWEMISRKGPSAYMSNGQKDVFKIEYWPRLSTQRLQKIAHVFKTPHSGKVQSIQVLTLQETDYFDDDDEDDFYGNTYSNDARKLIVTAAADGSIYVSSSESGEVCYRMDGFTDQLSSVCLCNNQNALITDGMKHLVCLHDFDIDEDINEKFDVEF